MRERDVHALQAHLRAVHGADPHERRRLRSGREIRKGAADAIEAYVKGKGGSFPPEVRAIVETSRSKAARRSSSPTAAESLGVVHLKDIVKGGIKERFAELRGWGSDGDDHRRQPADGGGDRRGGGGRRLPRAGDPGDEARADPRGPDGRTAGRDDGRRHERRARPLRRRTSPSR